ncbi:hypothetical protein J4Q44_G00346300 [Coregonus suidteri]|uniref:Fos-related antigen 2 n=1 Tax=Coregonus suidteri TaxID=861788 RepID=A0AAN8KIJ3_9TELE
MQLPSGPFIPTINAITSSQELQWMVQPAVLASMPGHCLRSQPYKPLDISNSWGPGSHTRLGVIRTVGNTHGRSRWSDQLNQAEEERMRLRRERNKLAAAKCLIRRRELTDQVQGETEHERDVEEYCPSVDCFTTPSMVSCSPAHVMDLSCLMLSHHHPSLGEQGRYDSSSREEALPTDLLSKHLPGRALVLRMDHWGHSSHPTVGPFFTAKWTH